MSELDRAALACTPLTAEQVRDIWNGHHGIPGNVRERFAFVRVMCASHERMRAENDGATALLEQAAGELDRHRTAIRAALSDLEDGAAADVWCRVRDRLRGVLASPDPPFHALEPGDAVMVRHDDHSLRRHIVRQRPWQLGHGAWVVGLSEVSGGYDLGRVVAFLGREG